MMDSFDDDAGASLDAVQAQLADLEERLAALDGALGELEWQDFLNEHPELAA